MVEWMESDGCKWKVGMAGEGNQKVRCQWEGRSGAVEEQVINLQV